MFGGSRTNACRDNSGAYTRARQMVASHQLDCVAGVYAADMYVDGSSAETRRAYRTNCIDDHMDICNCVNGRYVIGSITGIIFFRYVYVSTYESFIFISSSSFSISNASMDIGEPSSSRGASSPSSVLSDSARTDVSSRSPYNNDQLK